MLGKVVNSHVCGKTLNANIKLYRVVDAIWSYFGLLKPLADLKINHCRQTIKLYELWMCLIVQDNKMLQISPWAIASTWALAHISNASNHIKGDYFDKVVVGWGLCKTLDCIWPLGLLLREFVNANERGFYFVVLVRA